MGQGQTDHTGDPAAENGSLEEFVFSVEAFQETIGRLNQRYRDLEKRYLEINRQLEATNRQLQAAGEENRRFGDYLDCILKGIDVGIVTIDEFGLIRFFNPAAARLLGGDPSAIIGGSFAETFVEIHREFTGRQETTSIEIARPCPQTGRELQLAISVSPIGGEDQHAGAVYVVRDLTGAREMEKEMSRLKTLAALGEMSATLAHEIRNPLTGIAGYSGLLLRELPDGPERRWARQVEEGVHRLEKLILNMLEFAKDPRLDRRTIRWQNFGQEIANAFESGLLKKNVKLVRKFPDKWPSTQGDPSLLRQAVLNILQNAEQAVGEGGEISLTITPAAAGQLMLEISDNGQGMDDQTRENIFQPFFTTREQGTGLGLAITRKIIEAHGGTINVDSRPGKGARFAISLPAGA